MKLDELKEKLKNKKLNDNDIELILSHIKHIFENKEFQKRLSSEYYHHGDITLGNHIIDDMILTYKYCLKKQARVDIALKIAMFHDLYTMPWQNNVLAKNKKFFHKHGFTHPIEAVINAYTWFKEDFENIEDSRIIIDGIIHHMYPLPVAVLDNKLVNNLELNNYSLLKAIPDEILDIIFESCQRRKILNFSWTKSLYLEGRLLSKADKRVSMSQFHNFYSLLALLTGKNKSIKR